MRNDRVIWQSRLSAAFSGAVLGLLMAYPQEAMEAVRSACRLWAGSVLPALFPYMVFSQLLTSALGSGALTAPLAMLGGSPAGARLIGLSGAPREKAQRLAALCATASPLYILGTLSGGWRVLLAHWLGAAAAYGFVLLLQQKERPPSAHDTLPAPLPRPTFPEIVRDAALAMLSVCGCMALFSVLTALAVKLLPLSALPLAGLSAFLEMASGCAAILRLGLPENVAMPLTCAAVSFGGLSIFMQNAIFLRPAKVNLATQFLARIVHAAAAYGLCSLLYLS